MNRSELTSYIRSEALRLGFSGCGISGVDDLPEDLSYLKSWIQSKKNGQMLYMSADPGKRSDPKKLYSEARSVISVILNYYPGRSQPLADVPMVSKYAYGKDYHKVIKDKLKKLLANIREKEPGFEGRVFVDTAPVFEKARARESGLGWIGKNSLLITEQYGSYVFIGEIIVNTDLDHDQPVPDSCGTCTKCIDACPTGAIIKNGGIDSSKCISYYTIEHRGDLPSDQRERFGKWVYGCDICQDICPYNSDPVIHNTLEFQPCEDLLSMTKEDWYSMTEKRFCELFKGTAIERIGYDTFLRNLEFIRENLI